MKRRLLLSAAVLSLGTVAMMSRDRPEPSVRQEAPVAIGLDHPFWGIDYVLESHQGADVLSGGSMSMRFGKQPTNWKEGVEGEPSHAGGMFSMDFSVGCNDYFGDVIFNAERTLISDGFVGTMKYCHGVMEQEEWVVEFVESGPTLSVSEDWLFLAGPETTLSFRRTDYTRTLIGPLWTIGRIIVGAGYSWYSITPEPTVGFLESGELSLFDGCNTLRGHYVVSGDQVAFSDLHPMTDRPCTDDRMKVLSAQIRGVFADGTAQHSITVNRLRIERGDGGLMALTD